MIHTLLYDKHSCYLQLDIFNTLNMINIFPVSYTHLDVYKRQGEGVIYLQRLCFNKSTYLILINKVSLKEGYNNPL